jgi:hypothetical protein
MLPQARRRGGGGGGAASLDDALESIEAGSRAGGGANRSKAAGARCDDDLNDMLGGDRRGRRGPSAYRAGELSGWQDVLNAHFVARWNAINREQDPVVRITAQLYLGAANTLQQWVAFVDNNLVVPASFLILRPYQRYWMKSAILLKSGSQTGNTFIGHSDMMLSDNATQKMHYGHFTFYFKAVVKRPENIVVVKDLLADGVIGGGGVRFYTDPSQHNRVNGVYERDIFSVMIGYDEHVEGPRIDITGRFDPNFVKDQNANNLARTHYSSALFYSTMWDWRPTTDAYKDVEFFVNPTIHENTITYEGHHQLFDRTTGQFTIVRHNRGHWGDTVYEGCRRVRAGAQSMFAKRHEQPKTVIAY